MAKELPPVLILKLKHIQKFPNGQEVGLYYSDNLDQFVAVSLNNSDNNITKESILDTLKDISESDNIQTIIFRDLSELNINKECADAILNHIKDSDELIENVISSDKSFLEMLEEATIIPQTYH